MKNALMIVEGQRPVEVDLAGYARLKKQHPDARCICMECRQPLRANDKIAGESGFFAVNMEVTGHGENPKFPGFSHHKGNNGVKCKYYLPNDPRFAGKEKSETRKEETARMRTILADPVMQRSLEDVEAVLLRPLVGDETPKPVRKKLRSIENRLIGRTGYADNPWALPFAKMAMLGACERELEGSIQKVEYQEIGRISLDVTRYDGAPRALFTPDRIRLCYSDRGLEPVRLNGALLEFEVSKEFAHIIAETSQKMRLLATNPGALASRHRPFPDLI